MSSKVIRRVFSSKSKLGNLAVVEVCKSKVVFKNTQQLQQKAFKNSLAISAFIFLENFTPFPCYRIRWFSPVSEVIMCGHGALAAADVVISLLHANGKHKQCLFSNKGITVSLSMLGQYILHLPIVELVHIPLSQNILYLFKVDVLSAMQTDKDNGYIVIELADVTGVEAFDFDEKSFSEITQRALIVTCRCEDYSETIFFRYFAPQHGEKEDNATGSAAPVLAEFWQLLIGVRYCFIQLSASGGYYQVEREIDEVRVISDVYGE
ncbi:PhzF family phenazine biosynthesis protein [Shewanella eurypsychrophilus]|uniref:PhzF family phenazine biosynthesis protein n=1 Tax=Shewanella eurypsychrophilus TaxID=2593656 RepID=A0ABX6V914_9GAMM|nr:MULTISPECIES: PhzF family phenazine biosynthesis protein [Shewanella]QFU23052.1 hypothetical protein FS418_15010 [Shewanella sp. YLB-09]QPG58335.1 PhzF family phenazine biosynthesis protein [Shewanella eurypsychrophilus]